MADRVIVLVHDDWEIRGNGSGNVAQLQYLPALFLLDLCRELGMKVTFMAEVMQQLAMKRVAGGDRNIRIQAELWEESLRLYRDQGHDVQLHIHPHWHQAEWRDGFFHLGRNWNLATYPDEVRRDIIGTAVSYLTDLLRADDPAYTVHSFKAGSWGMQPSGGLMQDLEDAGIRLVMGPGRGIVLRSEHFSADYSGLEEDLLPYHPRYDDVQRLAAAPRPIVVLPLPWYEFTVRGLAGKAQRKLSDALRRTANAAPGMPQRRLPPDIVANAPLIPAQTGRWGAISRLKSVRSLSVSGTTFEELRFAIDQIMERCLRSEAEVVPLVIQGHTKDFPGHWDDVGRFYRYLVHRYERCIEFMTLSEFLAVLPTITVRSDDA